MKRVLIPSNCDLESTYALKLAAELAQSNHARVYVLRVIKTHGGAYFDSRGDIVEDQATDVQKYRNQKAEETQKLHQWASAIDPGAVQLVRYGGIADTILDSIKELKISLVIMGNRFAETDENRFFGTLTDYLLKRSTAPILSLKTDVSKKHLSDMVFANEFNKVYNYFDALQDLAQHTTATVHLLRVMTPKTNLSEEEVLNNMNRFAVENRLERYTCNLHDAEEVESGIMEWMSLHRHPLLAVKNITKVGRSPLFRPKLSKKFFTRSTVSTLIYNE